jgi:hypothetical protein
MGASILTTPFNWSLSNYAPSVRTATIIIPIVQPRTAKSRVRRLAIADACGYVRIGAESVWG